MTNGGYAAYNQSIAQTNEKKGRVLLRLYEGAVKFVRFARIGIKKNSPKVRGENISKVMAILTELDCALDRGMEGELVGNLADLYRYMMGRLAIANTGNDTVALDEVERLLLELKEAFERAYEAESLISPAQPEGEEPAVMGEVRVAV